MSPNEWWKVALVAVLAVAVLLHAFFPRHEWRSSNQGGSVSVVVYDRWTGRFQRAVYDDKGNLNVMGAYSPF
jgi:hypothetical protein